MTSRRTALAILAFLVGMAGCGGSNRTSPNATTDVGNQRGPTLLGAQADANRKVIYTADLVVRVSSVGRTSAQAIDETRRAGGYLFAQNADESTRTTELTLKVPSDKFDSLLDTIAGLGHVLRRSVKAQDVTADVVDVEGRLKTAQASADRLRTLLADAKTAADVVAVEGELSKREADIESLQGRRRVLTDQVDLATAVVRLTERKDLRVNHNLPGFVGALRSGWVALVNVVLLVVVAVGFLLPFAPLIALSIWLIRRYRQRHPKPARHSPPGWPPAPPPGDAPPQQQAEVPPTSSNEPSPGSGSP